MTVKYPNISVKLVGEDGNAFSIIARVTSALRSAGVSKEERDLFQAEAMKGDYDQLLGVVMDWVNCDEEDEDTEDEFDDEDDENFCFDCCNDVQYCTCDDVYEDYEEK